MSNFDVIRYDSGVFTVDFDRNGSFNLILPFLTLNTYFSAGCPAYPKQTVKKVTNSLYYIQQIRSLTSIQSNWVTPATLLKKEQIHCS